MPLFALSFTHGDVSPVFCTMSCTGWIFLSECSTNTVQLITSVCSIKIHGTCIFGLRHCSSVASAVCQLPPAVRTMSSLEFVVRPSGLLCRWTDDSLRESTCSFDIFRPILRTFPFLGLLAYTTRCDYALYKSTVENDIDTNVAIK